MEFIIIHSVDCGKEQQIYINPAAIVSFWKRGDTCAIIYQGGKESIDIRETPEEIIELIRKAKQSPIPAEK